MCGISGYLHQHKEYPVIYLQEMNEAIRHRGPDDEGFACLSEGKITNYAGSKSTFSIQQKLPGLPPALSCRLAMAFSRLSILDLTQQGHQPMVNETGNLVITFNGEIYNYKQLRAELVKEGLSFGSETDTEVILKGYQCWGKKIVSKLNGMFAFTLLDLSHNSLWLVRDRMGLKPLFYHRSESELTWASEIKALIKVPWVAREINWDGVTANFLLQTSPPPITCFKNILSVKPGSWLEIDLDSLSVKEQQYWHLPTGLTSIYRSSDEAAEELEDRLKRIVCLQSSADVPVISLMSGGIDSTTLTALLFKQDPSFQCYSMGFDKSGKGYDELPQAIATAQQLGISQKVHIVKMEEIIHHMSEELTHFEEPYCSLEPNLAAAKFLQAEGYKVAISGNGADEVFGGYTYYQKIAAWEHLQKFRWANPLLPSSGFYFSKIKNYLRMKTVGQYYAHTRQSMQYQDLMELLLPERKSSLLSLNQWISPPHKVRTPVEELFYFDLKLGISAHHVFRDDLSSMRYGLEMRYPYLDHTLVEWIASLPLSIRYDAKITKPLLRKVARKYLPAENLNMPKKGFSFPMDRWMKEKTILRDYSFYQLEKLKKRQLFNNHTINFWWRTQQNSTDFLRIWQLVSTEAWLEKYIDPS